MENLQHLWKKRGRNSHAPTPNSRIISSDTAISALPWVGWKNRKQACEERGKKRLREAIGQGWGREFPGKSGVFWGQWHPEGRGACLA